MAHLSQADRDAIVAEFTKMNENGIPQGTKKKALVLAAETGLTLGACLTATIVGGIYAYKGVMKGANWFIDNKISPNVGPVPMDAGAAEAS